MAGEQASLRDLIESRAARDGVGSRDLWKLALNAIAQDALAPILPDGISLDTKFDHGGRRLTWRTVIDSALHAIDRHEPSNDNWAKELKFCAAGFDTWLKSALKAKRIPAHPKRLSGRKPEVREAVASFIATRYPTGIPPEVTNKMIATEYAKSGRRRPSLRTVARARGGK
jgi:hypothetical protein